MRMIKYGRPVLDARLFYNIGACSVTCLPTLILPHPTQTSQIACLSVCLSVCLLAYMHIYVSVRLSVSVFIQVKSHGCLKYKLEVFKQTFCSADKNNLANAYLLGISWETLFQQNELSFAQFILFNALVCNVLHEIYKLFGLSVRILHPAGDITTVCVVPGNVSVKI